MSRIIRTSFFCTARPPLHPYWIFIYNVCVNGCSSELKTEISYLRTQLDKANLAKSVAESKLSDFDRYKSMIELEITELLARHKTVMTERVARTAQVGVAYIGGVVY